jgi:SpoIIAA-like
MIEALTGFPDNVAAFACHGHVTKADYETVLIPDLEKRLLDHDKVRIYYETAPDFAGIDPGAIWEDTKVGFSHFLRWERFAVVTDVEWIKQTMKFVGFLMPGELSAFPTAEADRARSWIVEESA